MDIIKRIGIFAILFFCFDFSFAQIVKTKSLPKFNPVIQQEPFEAIKLEPNSHKKNSKATGTYEKLGTPAPAPVFVIYPGSLKKNVTRLANEFGWKQVVWNAKYDYQWTGTTQITANNLSEILNKILKRYPLQAIFYQGNHVLAIRPRNFS